jgi:REP element-mobilizing transposase RayT
MPNYRRAFVPGGCWFFTANLLNRRSRLLTERIDALRDAIRQTRRRRPFHINAFVVLPDHLHAMWTLPPGDNRLLSALAIDQVGIRKIATQDGMAGSRTTGARRAGYLATSILGALDQG